MQIFFISTTFYSIELLVPSRLHNSFSQFGVDKIWIGPDQIGSDRIGSDRIGSDCSFRFANFTLVFGFRFSLKIQTGFPNLFRFVFDLSGN